MISFSQTYIEHFKINSRLANGLANLRITVNILGGLLLSNESLNRSQQSSSGAKAELKKFTHRLEGVDIFRL